MGEDVAEADDQQWLTVDELAAATNMTVRTARYYAGLGLIPPPQRRGRMAYYSPIHRARLEMIRALQEHGFTLAAIEKHLRQVPADASVEELAIHQRMLTSGMVSQYEVATKADIEARAGRSLTSESLHSLITMGAVRERDADSYELLPTFEVGIRALELDVPIDSIVLAGQAISSHMDRLVDELTSIFQEHVAEPYRRRTADGASGESDDFQSTLAQLRQLTVEAVLAGFQLAVNEIAMSSLDTESSG